MKFIVPATSRGYKSAENRFYFLNISGDRAKHIHEDTKWEYLFFKKKKREREKEDLFGLWPTQLLLYVNGVHIHHQRSQTVF